MKINYENEKFFLSLVSEGKIIVNVDGSVFNPKTSKFIGSGPKNSYLSIGWKFNGKVIHQLVHRLVFLVHGGILSEEFPLVNHIDGNKRNNHFSNLECSNNCHNVKHAYDTGLNKWDEQKSIKRTLLQQGEKGPRAILSNEEALKIHLLYSTGNFSHADLGIMFNVHRATIGYLLRGKTFKNIKGGLA